uniref:Uncharacterized protein n=1 Tax=Arundo donax TaxID=35708 RepID=A0A0A9PCX6_ARUDO
MWRGGRARSTWRRRCTGGSSGGGRRRRRCGRRWTVS